MTTVASLTSSEHIRRKNRKGSYHLVATKNKLPTDPDEEEEDYLFRYLVSTQPGIKNQVYVQQAKTLLLRELARSGGDTTTPQFKSALDQLTKFYDPNAFDARKKPRKHSSSRPGRVQPPELEGMWITLSKPQFSDCLGMNNDKEYMYTLGRMSFDMFRPTQLVCSIQGTFNPVRVVSSKDAQTIKNVPRSLKDEMREGNNVVRTYNIVTAFTIEPNNPRFGADSPNSIVDRPIEGLMTTEGYILPNPNNPNRLTIWFTGGSIELYSESKEDEKRWHRVFNSKTVQKRRFQEKTRVLGAKIIMGASPSDQMEEDGKMTYKLTRPVGGHDTAYVDLLFLDDTLRIAHSSSGITYVFAKIPVFPDE